MKKLIAIVLLAALALGLVACSPINKSDVAVLWKDGNKAVSPNTLINAMDRAMYIENIAYAYYGAQGDAARQLTQAQEALDAGCAALMVELVDAAAAQQYVDLAKAKNVPILFFGTVVDDAVAKGYENCVVVRTDTETLPVKYAEMVTEYLEDKKTVKNLDRNKDGKLSVVNQTGLELTLEVEGVELEITTEAAADPTLAEVILTADEDSALATLQLLQKADYNTDKLTTQYVALFTAGNTLDYKSLVLDAAPQDAEGKKKYFEASKYLVDLTTVEEEDLAGMIYTTANVIDSGRITGTAMEDDDALAEAAAAACAALIKGNRAEAVVKVAYTTYTG